MELTAAQKDAVTELINISYGRAAGALSELTGYRIILEVPKVTMHALAELAPMIEDVIAGPVASVQQVFSGPINGTAMLVLDEQSALVLTRMLTEESPREIGFDASAREIFTEVGNILLNACLGVFGNLLQVQVSFAVPQLQVDGVRQILETVTIQAGERLRYGLMVHTRFRVRTSNIVGYFVIILGITSLDRLLQELEQWEKWQS